MTATAGLSEGQRTARRDKVPGSWAAVAMGEDPERTLAELWHLWSGREAGIGAERARIGLGLEATIARLAEPVLGARLRRVGRTFVLGDLAASPDCYVLNAPAFAELKAWGGLLDGLPRRWYWQAVAQLAVRPDRERVEVVALTGANLRRYTVERADVAEDRDRLVARATDLRARFVAGEAPPPDPRDDASDVLTFAPLAPGESVATGDVLAAGDALAALVRTRKRAEADETILRRRLADVLVETGCAALRGPSWAAVARPARAGTTTLVFSAFGEVATADDA
jgi:predicted phage-related endonuclease